MAYDPYTDSQKYVRVGGKMMRKYQVGLGREFVEDGRVYQTTVSAGTYAHVEPGMRFRWHDDWYYEDPRYGMMLLEPNMPFGVPRPRRRALPYSDSVSILTVEDRGPYRAGA